MSATDTETNKHKHRTITLTPCFLVLFSAFFRYLNLIHNIELASSQYLHCQMSITVWNMSSTTSTLIILFMTFERFYSIIRPHKAASFNRLKELRSPSCPVVFLEFCMIFLNGSQPVPTNGDVFLLVRRGNQCLVRFTTG